MFRVCVFVICSMVLVFVRLLLFSLRFVLCMFVIVVGMSNGFVFIGVLFCVFCCLRLFVCVCRFLFLFG